MRAKWSSFLGFFLYFMSNLRLGQWLHRDHFYPTVIWSLTCPKVVVKATINCGNCKSNFIILYKKKYQCSSCGIELH